MPIFICTILQNDGLEIVPYTAIEEETDANFEALFNATINRASSAYDKFTKGMVNIDDVCSIKIRENGKSDAIEISKPDMSLAVCIDLNRKFVEIKLNCNSPTPCANQEKQKVDAFSRLMNASKTLSLPDKIAGNREELSGPQNLFNDLIEWVSTFDSGWSPQYKESANKVINCLEMLCGMLTAHMKNLRKMGVPFQCSLRNLVDITNLENTITGNQLSHKKK